MAWHEIKGAVIYRLEQAVQTAGGRGVIAQKYVVAWQGDPLEFGRRVQAEARRRGLAQVQEVFVVADGSLWIWNIQADRFSRAQGVLNFYHASQHLWAVAHALHPGDEALARAWVEPLLSQLRHGQEAGVLQTLEICQRGAGNSHGRCRRRRSGNGRIFRVTATLCIMRRGRRRAVRWAAGRWNPSARSCKGASNGAASSGVVTDWGTYWPWTWPGATSTGMRSGPKTRYGLTLHP